MQVEVVVPFRNVHAIREKLQVIVLAANGSNAPIITRTVLEIARLLPQDVFQPKFRQQSVG